MARARWQAPEAILQRTSEPATGVSTASWKLRLGRALVIPEVLATFAATSLLKAFVWLFGAALAWPWWAGGAALLAGVVAISVLVLTAMRDPELIETAARQALHDAMRIDRLRDPDIRRLLLQMIDARAHMERLLAEPHAGLNTITLTLKTADDWLSRIGRLVQVIEPVQHEQQAQSAQKLHLIDRIRDLETRIDMASNRSTAEQLRETMAARRMQLRAIEDLENVLERGLLRLEHASSALGAMDAKLALLVASGSDLSETQNVALDFDTELSEIDAVITALQRVYSGLTPQSGGAPPSGVLK